MYSQEEYLYGWLLYVLGVLLVMACGWVITARIPWRELRQLLRLLVAVALMVPWYASPDLHYLAPAWVIAAFEGLFDDNFWRAGGPLLSALAVALGLALIWQIAVRLINRRA